MNAKTTIALLLIAGALGAWLYVTETTDTGARPAATDGETGDRLFAEGAVESASSQSLTITTADGRTAKFTREGAKWRQVEPIAFNANALAIERVIDAAGDLRSSSTFKPSDKGYKLAEFGLDPPRAVLTIEDESGASRTLALGKTSAAGRAYAIAGYDKAKTTESTPIAIVDERVHNVIQDNPIAGLRDKSLPSIPAGGAEHVKLTRGDQEITLTKVDGLWKLGEAKQRAGASAVATLVGAFTAATVNTFVTDSPDHPADYGLDAPRATLTVTAAAKPPVVEGAEPGAPESHTLRIGNATDLSEDHYFAMLDDSPVVFTVPQAAVARLQVEVDALRDPKLTTVAESNLAEVAVQRGDADVKLARSEGRWKFAEPGPGFAGDGETISTAVASLFDARATGYVDVSLKDLKAPIATVTLTAVGLDAPTPLFVHDSGDGNVMTVFGNEQIARVVEADVLKSLLSPAWAMRDRTAVEATIDTITKVTIERTGKWPASYTIARKPPKAEGPSLNDEPEPQGADAWALDGLDPQKVGQVLGALAPLRGQSWRAEPIAEDAKNIAAVHVELADGSKKDIRVDLDANVATIDGIDHGLVLGEGAAAAFAAALRDTRVLTLDINQIALISTHGMTVTQGEDGAFTSVGDAKVDEAKAAALFNAIASLRADRFVAAPTDAAIVPTVINVKMRDGAEHTVTVIGDVVSVGDRFFTVSGPTAVALKANPQVETK